ncbi:hypothetical protein F2Q68_00029136 [Brassica cretica]|uniref:lipoyl(octanoyl) transferase n=1 Tax=Brassica cretica TaxID=69181 RepID=A0A8S9G882_BRACR|nr:hypothetical protein F2Q68_00029136 [Brassica cretica]
MESLHLVETLLSGLHHHPRTNANRNRVFRSVKVFSNTRKCQCFDLHDKLVPYKKAWTWQKRIVEEKKALIDGNQDCPDTVISLQHYPVYTMGTGSSEDYLNFDVKDAPFDVYRTERGGEVTYHGPGQLVMYPIINLRNHEMDLHWYLRTLEEVVIRVLSSAFSIKASRLDGLTGVWVGNQKVAAIGIRVSKWITYHGLALNVATDLTPFNSIVPCGIRDRQVGSIKCLLEGGEHGEVATNHASSVVSVPSPATPIPETDQVSASPDASVSTEIMEMADEHYLPVDASVESIFSVEDLHLDNFLMMDIDWIDDLV